MPDKVQLDTIGVGEGLALHFAAIEKINHILALCEEEIVTCVGSFKINETLRSLTAKSALRSLMMESTASAIEPVKGV